MLPIFKDLRGEASRKSLFDFLMLHTDLPDRLSYKVRRQGIDKDSVDGAVAELVNETCRKIIPPTWQDTLVSQLGVLVIFLIPPLYPLYEYAGKCFREQSWTGFGSSCVGITLLLLLFFVTVTKAIKDFGKGE